MSFEWVKDELKDAGKTQRDLAQAWAVSEGAVSRWMAGTERKDLPLSRFVALAGMLQMSLDELARRLGALGPKAETGAAAERARRTRALPITKPQMGLTDSGEAWVLMHIEVPYSVAVEVMNAVNNYKPSDPTKP